jgi:hypothetical protein
MAAFSLWQLLNQRRAFDNSDDSDSGQQQAAGQAIGQSLVDLWNRANADAIGLGSDDADAGPHVNYLVDYPPPPGTPPIQPQLLPYYPSDQPAHLLNLLDVPTVDGRPPTDPERPQPSGQRWASYAQDPNVHLVGWPDAAAKGAVEAGKYALPVVGALLNALKDRLWGRPAPTAPTPGSNASPSQPPIDSGPSNQNFGAPGIQGSDRQTPSATSLDGNASDAPELPDLFWQIKNPSLYDPPTQSASATPDVPSPAAGSSPIPSAPPSWPDLIDQLYRRTPEEEAAFPGDYSNGYHKELENAFIGWLRQNGCQVEPQVRFNAWGDPRYAIADWVAQCAGEKLPNLNDAKTGPWARFTRNQNTVYPAVEAGNGYSDDPKMATFGIPPGRVPAMVVNRIWSNPRGATATIDRPFGPMQ